jgi:hypothetical protein
MGETGQGRLFVGCADVIPDIDRNQRQAVILDQNNVEPVVEGVFLVVDLGDVAHRCGSGRGGHGGNGEQAEEKRFGKVHSDLKKLDGMPAP